MPIPEEPEVLGELPVAEPVLEPIIQPVTEPHIELVVPPVAAVPEYKEPEPEPVSYFMVVADDEPSYRTSMAEEAELVCKPIGSYRIAEVERFIDMLKQALMGNAGGPAHAVLLDDSYTNESYRWTPKFDEAQALAQELGIDLSAYKPPSFKDGSYTPNALSGMWNTASSTSYSLLLRALGYEGKILVLSSGPPDAERIEREHLEVSELVASHPDTFPVDGIISVNKSYKTVNYWANQRQTQPGMFLGHWDTHHNFEEKGQDYSLAGILQRML